VAISHDIGTPCAGSNLWFSTVPDEIAYAKSKCERCPVRRACAEMAASDNTDEGVYAGFNTAEPDEWHELETWLGNAVTRRRRRRGRPRKYACTTCGEKFTTGSTPEQPVRCQPCRSGLIDSGSTLAHLAYLRATGESWRSISLRAGLAPNTAAGIARRGKWIHKETSHAIRALTRLDMAAAS
jgi:hypothetical protein